MIQWRSGAAPGPRLALSPLPSSSGPAANQRAAGGGRGWRRRRTALPLAARGARSGLNRRRRAGGERTEGGWGGVVLTDPAVTDRRAWGRTRRSAGAGCPAVCRHGSVRGGCAVCPLGAAPAGSALTATPSFTAAMVKHKRRRRRPRGKTKAVPRSQRPAPPCDRGAAVRPASAHLPPVAATARPSLCPLPLPAVTHVVQPLAAVASLLLCWCRSAVAQVRPLLRCAARPAAGLSRKCSRVHCGT